MFSYIHCSYFAANSKNLSELFSIILLYIAVELDIAAIVIITIAIAPASYTISANFLFLDISKGPG
jgi:hypothetical protein